MALGKNDDSRADRFWPSAPVALGVTVQVHSLHGGLRDVASAFVGGNEVSAHSLRYRFAALRSPPAA